MPSVPFDVRLRREPITSVRLPDAINPGITYSNSFAEWEAAQAAGLNLWDWEHGGYTKYFKVKVLAWYKLHSLVEAHTKAAVNKKARADAKKK